MKTGDKVKVLEKLRDGLKVSGVSKDDLFIIGNVYEVVHTYKDGSVDIDIPNYCMGYGLEREEYELFGTKPYKEMSK